MIEGFVGYFITILCYFGYLCMVQKFCNGYLKISNKNKNLFVIFGFCIGMLINAMSKCYSIPNIIVSLLNHIFFIGLILLLFQRNTAKKILVFSILTALTTLVKNFCVSFFSCLLLFGLHKGEKITVPFLGEAELNLINCISLVITILVIYWASKHLTSIFYCKTGKWYIILAIPLLAITAIIDVANWGASNGILVRSGGNMGLYYDQIFSHAAFCVLTVLSILGAGFFVFGMDKIYLEQKKSSQYDFQIAAYKMLEEQYSQSERLRHDLKNHIIALVGLLENKEWKKMERYLKNMENSADFGIGEELTGNRVVDILLYQKRKIAERKNIIWECDVQIPKICLIDEFDLCVLFGNILDNAVEACERLQHNELYCTQRQFINIQAKTVKKFFLLEVKNSANMAGKHKIGFIDKEKSKERGIGLLNISDVVHRYNGALSIEVQNNVFVISILIPLSNTVHDIKQVI